MRRDWLTEQRLNVRLIRESLPCCLLRDMVLWFWSFGEVGLVDFHPSGPAAVYGAPRLMSYLVSEDRVREVHYLVQNAGEACRESLRRCLVEALPA